ncbi:MAG: hypothetical protein COV59_05485 [Candidatus Magasanikbacteria bacterium CG11_big_fil_rev_8_21_14_0_20_39_34]|uniref:DUF5667 domain-containing protein n=1 Tax=Candidatus Magasanikbacteria bacterium CG11_big_fil_rev_8_21_14_0_20_39_34 TaxID=1974653 RepID=A0A2H0N406_9BACT|nr:MAG: hypothetical protein COV59_05485 [Candidatus Magasanikbacteria bacterium CG11_big_fil_rev_8_21_14_0_20_39_34]
MQINRALLMLAIVATILTTGAGTAFTMEIAPSNEAAQIQESFGEKIPWTKTYGENFHKKSHKNTNHRFHRIMHPQELGMHEQIQQAIASQDYNAFKAALKQTQHNPWQNISESRFNQIVQVKKLKDEGKTDEAKQILKQLHENWKTLHNTEEMETQDEETEL